MATVIRNLSFEAHYLKARLATQIDNRVRDLAWLLPRRLVMWCFYRALCHATSGEWGNENPTQVKAWDVIERWNK